ncbi:extracellular solute-binding protein [Paludisphaera mucosa]|uniref:Extracellular solute-binding protein n=1 Tax=Paludisphaera mucosa TaxID=3030827 RepID=A0ABT6F7P8_9BACT|nr:extracellular solute-binding protein [Paludisphaera mucosa]MDG3003600.1 extracellular solute-binding protein [Paludisphaera mucosa]
MRWSVASRLVRLRHPFLALALLACLLGAAAGCSEPVAEAPKPPPTYPGVSLTIGAIGDTAILAGVAAQRGEWTATRKGEIAVATDAARTVENAGDLDVLVFPAQDLGALIDRNLLAVIPNAVVLPEAPAPEGAKPADRKSEASEDREAEGFQYMDVAPAFREQVSKYGSDRYALPIGGSTLILAYRRDAFTAEANVKAAKEQGLSLEPPATWAQLDALARFFQGRDWDGDGTPGFGLAAALGKDAEGVADATFLARAASLGQHRDHYSFLFDADDLAPRVVTPPFVEALKAIAAWKAVGPPGVEAFDVAAARAAFREGKVAMLIDRAEKAAEWSSDKAVAGAPLPGSERVYEPARKTWDAGGSINRPTYLPFGGGWLVGVRRGIADEKRAAAFDLALYVAEADVANRILAERAFPMLSVRASQMGRGLPDPSSARNVDPRSWSGAVSRSLMAERVLPGLRIPDAGGYLTDLSAGRVAAMAGKAPDEALRDVAAAWTARSKTLGVPRQLWHYRRSLNTLATLPEPPARDK